VYCATKKGAIMGIIRIPIRQQQYRQELKQEFKGLKSIWDRKRDLGLKLAPLDYWGRHRNNFQPQHLEKQLTIPEGVAHGHGDMHLDEWFEPDQLVKHAASDGVFEVRMNVSDFKPYELKVRLNEETRVVTIEGHHYEADLEHHTSQHHGGRSPIRSDSLHTHFKRSFTLSKEVHEEGIEVQLTPDGHHLIFKAPVMRSLAGMTARLCLDQGRSANLVKYSNNFVEDMRG
jgi:hypothetical protein